MTKLLALLMALMMCCTAFAFAEEEAEVPAVEMNVSFEAQTVALGETGLTMQIPADWAVQEVPAGTENAENILLFAVNADQTVSITAQLSAMSFETLHTEHHQQEPDTTGQGLGAGAAGERNRRWHMGQYGLG